jgi:hypothetical protein
LRTGVEKVSMSTAVEHGLVGLSQILRYKPAVKCVQKTDEQGNMRTPFGYAPE